MKSPIANGLVALALVTRDAVAFQPPGLIRGHFHTANTGNKRSLSTRQSGSARSPILPSVPGYNASLPVDHFNASSTATYLNQFFVNDTYYLPGGPVILFDFGETGVTEVDLAIYLAEWNGTVSAPLELARELHGVVVGWEHRYYGQSQPVPVHNEWEATAGTILGGIDDAMANANLPVEGAPGYRFLTVRQALEDVAFFAKEVFNQTQLTNVNNTVLGGVNATQGLDPYHTPWIWVGGSYPGSRGIWSRQSHPEVIYAVWASSAPVEMIADGSAYYNSIYRALPKNCTSDIQAVMEHIDEVLSGDDPTAALAVKVALRYAGFSSSYIFSDHAPDVIEEAQNMTNLETAQYLVYYTKLVQSYGVSATAQKFCDHMQEFDTASYLSNSSVQSINITTSASVFFYNSGNATPSDSGIVATSDDISVGVAAYMYALHRYLYEDLEAIYAQGVTSYGNSVSSVYANLHSWDWQVLNEIGLVVATNASSPTHLGSKFYDYAAFVNYTRYELFPSMKDAFPAEPDTEYPMSFGGWDMGLSNTMVTTGEFDPWRAFTVFSLEQTDLGAPAPRKIQADVIPECGQEYPGAGALGLIYAGAVHAEDMADMPWAQRGSQDTENPPVKQGAELFVRAYNAWLPCFNESRTDTGAGTRGNETSESAAVGRGGRGDLVLVGTVLLMGVMVV